MGKVTQHFPTVSRPMCRGESTSVLRLYQRVSVQLFSISTGNGTKRLPLEWRECNFNIKRNAGCNSLITMHINCIPINQSIYKYLLSAYSNKDSIMCQTLCGIIFKYYYQSLRQHYKIINRILWMRTNTQRS